MRKFINSNHRVTPLEDFKPYDFELVAEYEKLKITCSTRTINILEQLEIESEFSSGFSAKLNFLNTYFFQSFNFSAIRNSGKKTIDQIHNILKTLHEIVEQGNEGNRTDPKDQKTRQASSEKVNIETVEEYQILKSKCRIRTINVLELLEEEQDFHLNESAKISFIENMFFSTINYKSIKKAGDRTVDELVGIRQALWKFISAPSSPVKVSSPVLKLNILEKHLVHSFPDVDLETLKIEAMFSVQRVFCALFSELRLSRNVGVILHFYFFQSSNLSYYQIAEMAGCTRERVRQIFNKLNDSILPGLINSLSTFKDYLVLENVVPNGSDSIIEINPISNFKFNGKDFASNFNRDKVVLSSFLKDEYTIINDLLLIRNPKKVVFDFKTTLFFLKKELVEDVRISELLEFLNEQIYEFETVQFDYNLRILIERFYKESDQNLASEIIDVLLTLIKKIKVENILVDMGKLHRLEKSQRTDEIKSLVEDLLRGSQSGIRTQTILEFLSQNHIEIGIQQLLAILGRATQQFARIGHGAWVLKELLPNNEMRGSVREIVEGLLNDTEKPLHISELLSFFKTFRPLSEHSLRTNLKVSENIHFTFFNCGYIGKKKKKYDDSWYLIPPFNPRKFTLILNNKSLNYNEKIDSLVNIGFPRIHCEYLIRNREEKGK